MVDFRLRQSSTIDPRFRADRNSKSGSQRFSEDLQAAFLEFIGTTFFLLIGLGGIQAGAAATGVRDATSSNVDSNMYVHYLDTTCHPTS
jgi:hypothetical protein